MITDFPREDLAPLRHQQVRTLLVREAGGATAGRRTAARRLTPALAGLAVLGLGTAAALPSTGLGAALGSAVGSAYSDLANPCPPRGDTGYSPEFRRPDAAADRSATQFVRFLPYGLRPDHVTYRMESSCPLPERDDRPVMRPDALWTLARMEQQPGGTATRVDATLTLWRGLAAGISRQVADRTSAHLPTDAGDPGTVLDPPYEAVQVRGVTGTLATYPAGGTKFVVIWTDGEGREWSLSSTGLTRDELLTAAERLTPSEQTLVPEESPLVTAGVPGLPTQVSPYASTFWYQLDVPHAQADADPGTVVRTPYLEADWVEPGSTRRTLMQVWGSAPGFLPWQAMLQAGDGLVPYRDGVALWSGNRLTATLPDGAQVEVWQVPEPAYGTSPDHETAVLDALAAVPVDDPRLADADLGS